MTVVWRQTAYRMRHCFARRIDETGDRRKLVCTSNKIGRAAADDRSKSNRLATPNAATPRAGIPIPEAQKSFEPETANLKPFSRGIKRGILSFVKENGPFGTPRERLRLAVSGLDDFYASGMKMPARGVAALALLYDLSCFYYPLPLCLSCRSAQ